MNDHALQINTAQLSDRYSVVPRIYEIANVSQQMSPTQQIHKVPSNQAINNIPKNSELSSKSKDLDIVIDQQDMMKREHQRVLTGRDKIDTLQNLRQQSERKASLLTGS